MDSKDIDKEITDLLEKIKIKRKELKLSQKNIADYLGITQRAYGKIEAGGTEIKLKTLYLIGQKLGIDIFTPKDDVKEEIMISPENIIQHMVTKADLAHLSGDIDELKKMVQSLLDNDKKE